jgi:hypothetical protein
LLTLITKAYLTDTALNTVLDAQMVFGDHGYIREWGMQQCVRDLQISQIYEGTNGVQAQDLIGRKTIRKNGTNMTKYITEIREFFATLDNSLAIKAATLKACNEVEAITRFILQQAKGQLILLMGLR